MHLIVGLSNPGEQYAKTRHNIGRRVAEELCSRYGFLPELEKKQKARLAQISISGVKVLVAIPITYMNHTGFAVQSIASYYKIVPQSIIAVHDDIDLEFGRIAAKSGGGEAGHNGLRSISSLLGTREYARLRVGVSRPSHPQFPVDKYVLSNFTSSEEKELPYVINKAADGLELIIREGLIKAQAKINDRRAIP
jgi:PTH1 family peptidyl-tRNA hydrolase